MGGRVSWIADSEALATAVARVGDGPLAVDTEADSFHHYREKICLLQLTFGGEDLLVDTLSGIDQEPLRSILAASSIRKILHGSDYDLRLLQRDLEAPVKGLFDTMIAARLVGERSFGLAALLGKYFDIRVDKKFQRADWSIRPLPSEMRDYAATDTRHLEALAAVLEDRLGQLGRTEWAQEEFDRLEDVRWSVEAHGEERYLKVRGSGRLDRRGLAVLRELYALRDAEARGADVAPFRILREDVLLRLARSAAEKGSAAQVEGAAPPSWRKGQRRGALLEAVERGLRLPDEELPSRPERTRKRIDPVFEKRAKGLRADRERLASTLDLEPSVVAPRATLERALAEVDQGGDPGEIAEMRRWQAVLLRPLLERWQA